MALTALRAAPATTAAIQQFFSAATPRGAKNLVKSGLYVLLAVLAAFFIMWLVGIPTDLNLVVLGVHVEISMLVLIMGILFWMDGNIYIRTHQVGMTRYHYAFASLVVMITVVLAIAFHELMHGLVAAWCGYPIDKAGISWWGAFVRPNIESYDVMPPFYQMAIAAAGPISNFLLAGIAAIIVWHKGESLFENTTQYFAVTNIRLGKFNLIPLIVFDGGKVIDGLLRFISENGTFRLIASAVLFGIFLILHRKWRERYPERLEDKLARL